MKKPITYSIQHTTCPNIWKQINFVPMKMANLDGNTSTKL
ncbi:hypothetical protein KSS87_007284 [Heliosperma pusillum]|nr:hypothetical protein KSS87_007284 [Heliosperma pusillum]